MSLHCNDFVTSVERVVIKLKIVKYLRETLSTRNLIVPFTIIHLNRSIVHDIEHFITEGNNFMVYICLSLYIKKDIYF